MYKCKRCNSETVKKNGRNIIDGRIIQKYVCKKCGYNFEIRLGRADGKINPPDNRELIINAAQLLPNSDVYFTESEFITRCNIVASNGFRAILSDPIFDSYRGRIQGVIYYSHPLNIKRLKNDGTLL